MIMTVFAGIAEFERDLIRERAAAGRMVAKSKGVHFGRPRKLNSQQPAGSPANWRCIVLEKLSAVKLLNDGWRTAPNHSRPASCVVEADIDAEDHFERDPQKGH